MSKLLFLAFLGLTITSYSQNKRVAHEIHQLQQRHTVFEMADLFIESDPPYDQKHDTIVSKATYVNLDLVQLAKIYNAKPSFVQLKISYQDRILEILLYRVNVFTGDFKIHTDKQNNIGYTKGNHCRGVIKGDENSLASFNFFENEINGIVSSLELGNLNIGKLIKPANQKEYIVYSDKDLLIKNKFICNTKDDAEANPAGKSQRHGLLTEKRVTSYFEVGYGAYTANGSDLTATLNWLTSIFNNAQTLFQDYGIPVVLKTVFVWTTDDNFTVSSNFILPAFANIRPSFDGDVGFIADIDSSQTLSQAFSVGGLCSDRKFAYGILALGFEQVPTVSYSVYIMAHEMGHSLGSHHTHACVWNGNNTAIDGCAPTYGGCVNLPQPPDGIGTIMSYCYPSFVLGFGEQPAAAILRHISDSSCLGTDESNSCINTIDAIHITEVTQNSATIGWQDFDSSRLQWDVSVVPSGDAPVWNTVFANSYAPNNLIPNTHYEVSIRGECQGNLTYPKHSLICTTQGDNCAGTIIYDTGGPNNGYRGGEHIIRTLVPTAPNKRIKLVFNSLNLVPFEGWLFVYDGMDHGGPLLNYLTFGYPFLAYGFANYFDPFGASFESQDP